MTIHLLSQLSPSQTLRAPLFQTPLLRIFCSKSSSNMYGFSFLNSFLLDSVFFPFDYSHLFMFSRWVCVSAIALCSCLACGCCCLSLKLFLLLFLVFIMCLAKFFFGYSFYLNLCWWVNSKCSYYGCEAYCAECAWSIVWIYWEHLWVLLCWLWVMSFSSHCMSHWHISVFRMFSISAALILPCILPVVLVFPLLGLFIHVVDLSSIMFKCSSSSVWLQFLC